MKIVAIAVVAFGLVGCSKKTPSAVDLCHELETGGVARNCKSGSPSGIGAAAKECAWFDLADVDGRTGQVLTFDDSDTYDRTVRAFEAAAVLAGPHRYGSSSARVFVQMNNHATDVDAAKVKAFVAHL